MTNDAAEDPADLIEQALRAYGEQMLPPDFDATLRSYDELMAAIHETMQRPCPEEDSNPQPAE